MIKSNNVLQQFEPFHVYRHLREENVWLCLSFSDIIFFFGGGGGSPGPKTAAVTKGPPKLNPQMNFEGDDRVL